MGIKTRVYEADGRPAINIPSSALPSEEIVEEIVTIPGDLIQTKTTAPVWVRGYPLEQPTTFALLLTGYPYTMSPFDYLTMLGFDPYKKIEIRFPYSDRWLPASLFHGYYGRVRQTAAIIHEGAHLHHTYPVFIRGRSPPTRKIRVRRAPLSHVRVRHFGSIYEAERIGLNWQWIIPSDIEGYHALTTALNDKIYPDAECHLGNDNIINVDFRFTSTAGSYIAKQTNRTYRTMTLRNFSAVQTIEYPFLCEIRATYLTAIPIEYYQDPIRYMKMIDALRITVKNLTDTFTTSIRHAEKQEKVYATLGDEDNNIKIDTAEVPGFPYYRCDKYVRIVNEYYYKKGFDKEYTNDEIDNMYRDHPFMKVDINGFIWH